MPGERLILFVSSLVENRRAEYSWRKSALVHARVITHIGVGRNVMLREGWRVIGSCSIQLSFLLLLDHKFIELRSMHTRLSCTVSFFISVSTTRTINYATRVLYSDLSPSSDVGLVNRTSGFSFNDVDHNDHVISEFDSNSSLNEQICPNRN